MACTGMKVRRQSVMRCRCTISISNNPNDIIMTGFGNTMCKMLLGQNHFKGKRPGELNWEDIESVDSRLVAEKAIENLDQCVVGLQNEWEDTKRILFHFFPWLAFDDDTKMNTGGVKGSSMETRDELRGELRRELERVNSCDMAVWEHAVKRFAVQKEAVREME